MGEQKIPNERRNFRVRPVGDSYPGTSSSWTRRMAWSRTSRTVNSTPSERKLSPCRGEPTEGVEGEAADGLEIAVGRQVQAQPFVDLLRRRSVASTSYREPPEGDDRVFRRGDVVLVVDRPHERLEQVLERDQAGDPAVLVEHDGDLAPPGPELVQQVVGVLGLRHEVRPAGSACEARSSRRRPSLGHRREQVLGVEDAEDVVAVLAEHGDAAQAGIAERLARPWRAEVVAGRTTIEELGVMISETSRRVRATTCSRTWPGSTRGARPRESTGSSGSCSNSTSTLAGLGGGVGRARPAGRPASRRAWNTEISGMAARARTAPAEGPDPRRAGSRPRPGR